MNCSVQPATATRKTVSVNGKIVPHSVIARETQNHPAATPVEAWFAAARALALRELLLQEVQRLSVVAEPLVDKDGRAETPEEAAMRALIELEIRTPEPGDAECQRYYDNNLARFRSASISEAAHILVPAPPNDLDARSAAQTRAQAICEHLARRPDDFADLADEFSACPSAKQGGNLGQLSGGDTVPEFEKALARLSPGEITTKPVETRFGFHVIRLARRVEGRQLPFDLVRARIADHLAERVRRRALSQYVAVLAAKADLRGVEFARAENLM